MTNLGEKLAEGKTKIVYAHPTDPALALLQHKDGITAGDGARRNVIDGKGALAGRTTANVFALLNRSGIATHFVESPEPTLTVVRRCAMLPLEVVMRRRATGSYLKRHPEVAEGSRFDPPLVEFFLKDDARHDPQVSEAEIVALGLANEAEVAAMIETGRKVFAVLEDAWARQDVTLVDLKIEFGREARTQNPEPRTQNPEPNQVSGLAHSVLSTQYSVLSTQHSALLVADVIDNDSWRIWPGGEKGRMLDKQVYRNAQQVDEDVLADIKRRYETVADMTSQFE
ncbi:MAG: phosphoribosylaminoimidazolesuccinocarboxamide synthase [Chloroflexaceae bacterium]|jgi:phosphoribosylaminoimidazole-succinocarboxamide synthase|nr:phosphoribosylaminoimidazolesuccinocarboxamide synthase [Chloroflexaceae bacterium]